MLLNNGMLTLILLFSNNIELLQPERLEIDAFSCCHTSLTDDCIFIDSILII